MDIQSIQSRALQSSLEIFFKEDDLERNFTYTNSLPNDLVNCSLFVKSDLKLVGLPFFFASFEYLGAKVENKSELLELEGTDFTVDGKEKALSIVLPFSIALTGERIALNLLQRASSIATFTQKFVTKAQKKNISILDTRKTTPGLRFLEKYAVKAGGGCNHRLGQSDVWMVKDNHKSFFGGVDKAVAFFKEMGNFYAPIEVEVHNFNEISQAHELGIKHLMLDNFQPEDLERAIALKEPGMTYEVSGGVTLENIDSYLVEGIDAISIGSLTYAAPPVDVSFKMDYKL